MRCVISVYSCVSSTPFLFPGRVAKALELAHIAASADCLVSGIHEMPTCKISKHHHCRQVFTRHPAHGASQHLNIEQGEETASGWKCCSRGSSYRPTSPRSSPLSPSIHGSAAAVRESKSGVRHQHHDSTIQFSPNNVGAGWVGIFTLLVRSANREPPFLES